MTWIDLGKNVDIFSLPQPFLVSLRKRCPKQGNLPTILEFGESQASEPPERPKRRTAGEPGGRAGQEEEAELGVGRDQHGRILGQTPPLTTRHTWHGVCLSVI